MRFIYRHFKTYKWTSINPFFSDALIRNFLDLLQIVHRSDNELTNILGMLTSKKGYQELIVLKALKVAEMMRAYRQKVLRPRQDCISLLVAGYNVR